MEGRNIEDITAHDGAAFSDEDAARCAWAMTLLHPWLEFRAHPGVRGEVTISELITDEAVTSGWNARIQADFVRQGGDPPPHVAGVFVLQYALGALAAATATAALAGPWRADPRLTEIDLGPRHFPAVVHVGGFRPAHHSAEERLQGARAAYRQVAEPLAAGLELGGHLGRHQRAGMVRDAWEMAVRDLREPGRVVQRQACCYIYALPGCAECAGCPRTR